MYGLLVGISCLIAFASLAGAYHYAAVQNQLVLEYSRYLSITRLEAFQMPFHEIQNASLLDADAKIDGIGLYISNGLAMISYGGYYSFTPGDGMQIRMRDTTRGTPLGT